MRGLPSSTSFWVVGVLDHPSASSSAMIRPACAAAADLRLRFLPLEEEEGGSAERYLEAR